MLVAVFGLPLFVILFAIAWIDLATFRIPNLLNLLLAVIGIAWQIHLGLTPVHWQIFFALILAGTVFAVRHFFYQRTGLHGLGMGDVKMAGAAGLWIFPHNLPLFVMISSLSGLSYALIKNGTSRVHAVPFGPFLAFGLFVTWVWEIIG